MRNYPITVEADPKPEEKRLISDRLAAHNKLLFGDMEPTKLGIFIREDGQILGGIHGDIGGGWLFVVAFWLHERLRGQDYGSHMLALMEQAAVQRGITRAHLDTAEFQARPFYEKCGYSVYGTIENIVSGYRMFLMEKRSLDGKDDLAGRSSVGHYELQVESPASPNDIQALHQHLDVYNRSFQGDFRRAELSLFLRDGDGTIVAGLNGRFLGHWFFHEELWVDEGLRGQGLGRQLLVRAEQEAALREATVARVYLMGDHEMPFFQRAGYHAITNHHDCPAGYNTYNLVKSLSASP